MKLFHDTASLKDISWATQAGLIDGITTNPSLLAKQAGDLDPKDVLKEICSLVEGPVSAEVVAVDVEGMLKEGKELAKIADNIVVKIPMIEAGMIAVRRLAADGIKANVTLCFSSVQCLIAAKAVWGERRRIGLWRRLWLALMEGQRELGLAIPDDALRQLRAHLDDADLDRAAEHERRLRHDVMAHVHHLGEQAPAARAFLHLGATSAYVTDNTDLLLMREGMQILLGRIAAVLVALSKPARRHRALPCLAYTHFQPAQLTTVGKRVTLWMHEFLLDAEELLHRLTTLQFRGVKGTTGTQASFVELFDGDVEKARELDARVAKKMGFARVFPVTGQTYPRKADAQILAALSGVAASAAKFATDLRLLQHEGEMLEPFESEQVGSSAMPYKRNPMRAERMTSLGRFVIELEGNAWHTAASQWLERTLDDSANRRIVLPEAFLATDGILVLATNVAAGLEVREAVIARRVQEAMPFLATERWLVRGVKAGGDRQELHEVIRGHSLAVAQAVAETGAANDLLERLARDPAFRRLGMRAAPDEREPATYVGRAPQQVDEFLDEVVPPVLRQIEAAAPAAAAAEVTV